MKGKRVKSVSYAKYGYIFCIPFVLAFCIFMLYPMATTISYAFSDFQGAQKFQSGQYSMLDKPFDNFRLLLFDNQLFIQSMSNTFKIWIMNFIPQMVLALVLAAWFTNHRNEIRGKGLFKVIFYMPNIITAGSIAILFSALFAFPTGPMNYLRELVGLPAHNFLRDAAASQYIVSFIQFWMWYGYTMLIMISGIMGLNPEMFESAEIDGATGIQQFFRITLPNLRTIIIYMLVTSVVGGITMFDIPYLFNNNGGPANATATLATFIYNQMHSGAFFYNRAAAASLIVFVIVAILSAVIFMIMSDKDARRLRREEKALRRAIKAEGRAK